MQAESPLQPRCDGARGGIKRDKSVQDVNGWPATSGCLAKAVPLASEANGALERFGPTRDEVTDGL